MTPHDSDASLQRSYYARTASQYEHLHCDPQDEHQFALAILSGLIPFLEVTSLLDVGSGTGRTLRYLKTRHPELRLVGVEPVPELRQIAYRNGVDPSCLVDGEATRLQFPSASFDVVCSFAVLHHVREPAAVIQEMLRVAQKGIFISDSNNWGQGSLSRRLLKHALRAVALWKVAIYVRTRGKGFLFSEEDGVSYPYSVFDNLGLIREHCRAVHIITTAPTLGVHPLWSAPHIGLLALKDATR